MLSHPAHAVALGLGSGLAPKAPGTVGSLWGWVSWLVIHNVLSTTAQGLLIVCAILFGWWACTVTARNMGVSDPGSIVWDEIVAMWLIFWLIMPTGFVGQLCAFALFRFFDAVKPDGDLPSGAARAHALMESNQHIGKIVLTWAQA